MKNVIFDTLLKLGLGAIGLSLFGAGVIVIVLICYFVATIPIVSAIIGIILFVMLVYHAGTLVKYLLDSRKYTKQNG